MRSIERKDSGGRVSSIGSHRGALPPQIDRNDSSLSGAEGLLLKALGLYRSAIPKNHRAILERHLSVTGAWAGLVSRGYIIPDIKPWYVTLSASCSKWTDIPAPVRPDGVRGLHSAIADCWLEELGRGERALKQARVQACEALHHLTEAGDDLRLPLIAPELLLKDLGWAKLRLKKLYDTIYHNHAPIQRQRLLLQYRLLLDPDNHAIHRFLGQCRQKEEGRGSAKAIACFETACRLRPDYPPYLADLGHAHLAGGRRGAGEFLARLENVARDYPAAINDHVHSVRIACIKAVNGAGEADGIRREELSSSRNPAFYADEARAQIKAGNPALALESITRAEKLGCGNDYTTVIKTTALEKLGLKGEAADLRLEKIASGSLNPVFYSAEAKARLDCGDPVGALAILDLALGRKLEDDYLSAIRAAALERSGRDVEAAAIRMAKIVANSRNCVFYNDEANVRMMAGNYGGAREILELAVKNNCANQVTSYLWAKVERMEGEAERTDLPAIRPSCK